MKKNKSNIYLVYVVACERRVKKFKSLKKLNKFVDKFCKLHKEEFYSYWVDMIVIGSIKKFKLKWGSCR